MTEWREVKLGDVCNFNPTERLTKGAMAKKIAMEKLNPFSRQISDYEIAAYTGGTKFRNGDTIMARITPCLENGKIAQVKILDDVEIGFGSTEYIVFRAKPMVSDPNFLYYLVSSPLVREPAIKSMVGSSGRQRVQTNVIENLELLLPPLDEQERIAGILGALDDKIELNNKINQNLESQAQALFKSWFVDFEPFGGTMPTDWKIGKLLDIAEKIICGKTPSTQKKEYYGDTIPFITIPDMHKNIYVIKTQRYLSKSGAESQKGKMLPLNSVCVSCIGTAGLVSLVAFESQTNQQINSIISKKDISPYYVFLLMKNLSEKIQSLGAGGSTICNLNKEQFSNIDILIPSRSMLKNFHDCISPLFEQIKTNQIENTRLAELRDGLLPKLLSGEIKV